MRTNNEVTADWIADRMARVSAQYEAQLHQTAAGEFSLEGLSQRVIEVPCKLAPAVRRRPARHLPEQRDGNSE